MTKLFQPTLEKVKMDKDEQERCVQVGFHGDLTCRLDFSKALTQRTQKVKPGKK